MDRSLACGARHRRSLLSTKVFHSVEGDPADRGLAADRILRQIEGSLTRLGVERVDMYLIHEPDPQTPLEETLGALDQLVRSGKVGAIGASNVESAWIEEALAIAERERLTPIGWVQNSYSLLDRDAEREVLPLCAERGLGFTPFGPLSGGWLTGKYRRGRAAAGRLEDDPAAGALLASRPCGGLPRARRVRGGRGRARRGFGHAGASPGCSAIPTSPR